MKKSVFYFLACLFSFASCIKHELPDYQRTEKEQIKDNVSFVFGVDFDENHDWCTTTAGEVKIINIPFDVKKVQIIAYVEDTDSTTSLFVLNECDTNGMSEVSLNYDAPKNNLGLLASFISDSKKTYSFVENGVADYASRSMTRSSASDYILPSATPKIAISPIPSYAMERGWIDEEYLYTMYDYRAMTANDYSLTFKEILRSVIFSYFKNGRGYNNLPLVKKSGYYNENAYPITTGDEPIIVSPIYKCDKAKQYGNEVWNSELYYYYFKESDLEGKNPVEYISHLPKYRAIKFNEHFGETEDDVISKRNAYALVYFGDGTPVSDQEGTFHFPKGYKIGFMVKANTKTEAPKKQGELYGDGRLNNNINKWPNFSSSKLGTDGPRVAWITISDKLFMTWESGTDSDFNDIILEVEGGIEPIPIIPELECNTYTFCFEDTKLGDYDMNDAVIKAERVDETTVKYSIIACGAYDEIILRGINGNIIKDGVELHSLFGKGMEYINTVQGQNDAIVTEIIKVDKDFSFLNESTQPYIENKTKNNIVKLSKKGEDPHGIMIPFDFRHPLEKVCIKDAYKEFNSWGKNSIISTDWYKRPEDNCTFKFTNGNQQ